MGKVYVVTTDEFLDNYTIAVFSCKSVADVYVENYRQRARIEEHTLDGPFEFSEITQVTMGRDGSIQTVETFTDIHPLCVPGFIGFLSRAWRPAGASKHLLMWSMLTGDTTKAIKVTNEKRVAIIAAGTWGDYRKTKELIR